MSMKPVKPFQISHEKIGVFNTIIQVDIDNKKQ